MNPVPALTVVTFRDNRRVRAFGIPTPLTSGFYHGSIAEEEALDQDSRWLVFHLNAMFGVKRFWLVAAQSDNQIANRLLVELDSGYDWKEVEERVLDRLARHFDWPHADLYLHLKRRTAKRDPFASLGTAAA